jgi:hypothetical protein
MSTSTATQRSASLPSAPLFIGAVYAVCVLGMDLVATSGIVFSDEDPHRSEGPIEEIIGVSIVGTTALVIGVGLYAWLSRTPERARTGTYILAALSVLTLVVFWSGAPAIFGACAASCAGLTRGGRPLGGGARIAGIVGAAIALVDVVVVGGVALSHIVG